MSTMNIGTEKFSIRMEPSGVEVRCGSDQTVLDAAIRSGMSVPYGCRHGNCSSCKAKVVDGDYELMNRVSEFALMEFERQEGYILMCSTWPRSDMIMEVEEDEEPGLQLFPVCDFSGEVVSNERVTPDIHVIRIQLNEPRDIPYAAGQYFEFDVPGLEETRAYSMASEYASSGLVEFHVKLIQQGRGSSYLTSLRSGDVVSGSGPFGRMQLRSLDNDIVFVAGGSGLAPIKALLESAFAQGFTRQAWLFYGARTSKDLYLTEQWYDWEQKYPNFHFIPALSNREDGEAWDGKEGFIAEVMAQSFESLNDTVAYLCGPPIMIQTTLKSLYKLGVRSSLIYYDEF